jgi:hypothetical protein
MTLFLFAVVILRKGKKSNIENNSTAKITKLRVIF